MNEVWEKRRKRTFEIIEVGTDYDFVSRAYDFVNVMAIILNLIASIMYTFDEIKAAIGSTLVVIEAVTVIFFGVDYVLRVWTAKYLYPEVTAATAVRRYVFSFTGTVDFFSFFPYFLPVFFPAGTVAFRMLRIIRIFRLFRINAYYDSLNVITEVIVGKKQQLISSIFIILILMLASSLCMYSLEHEAQPEVFSNAFSGIWWAASTLLTVGYGDIYPITTMGKLLGIGIAFLGVGIVAIPTGIISAGFVEQYSSIKARVEMGYEEDIHFIKISITENDKWNGKAVRELNLPEGVIMAAVKRGTRVIIPQGDTVIEEGDRIILGAEPSDVHEFIKLKEIVLEERHPWVGMKIEELDISRQSIIVLVKRGEKALIPNGNLILQDDDRVYLYTQKSILGAMEIDV